MLTKKMRKQIEGHFFNYKEYLSLYNEKVLDIIESGLTARYDRVGSRGSVPGNPTESKALRLEELDREKCWATVVLNTFNAFRFKPEYDIMVDLYIKRRNRKEIFCDGLLESTFYRWRDRWLTCAYQWAKELKLI